MPHPASIRAPSWYAMPFRPVSRFDILHASIKSTYNLLRCLHYSLMPYHLQSADKYPINHDSARSGSVISVVNPAVYNAPHAACLLRHLLFPFACSSRTGFHHPQAQTNHTINAIEDTVNINAIKFFFRISFCLCLFLAPQNYTRSLSSPPSSYHPIA